MASDLSKLYQFILKLDAFQQQELLALLEKKLRPVPDLSAQQFVREPQTMPVSFQGGNTMATLVEHLINRLTQLPPAIQAEVGEFIEFLYLREQQQPLKTGIARASESTFAKVWDNDDDAAYDKL